MRFPEREVDVVALTVRVAEGMAKAPDDYPNPPVPPDTLFALHHKYDDLKKKILAATEALRGLHEEKDGVYLEMKQGTKENLQYGILRARRHPELLTGLGWEPPHKKRPLELPGEVRDIKVGEQGETTVELSWGKPVGGGAVASYSIERRTKGGEWGTAATTSNLKVVLKAQPRGLDLEYRVRAINRTGEGAVSGTVNVVL